MLPKSEAGDIYKKYVTFEKQHGDRRGIEQVVTSKKRFQYEEAVKADPYLYAGEPADAQIDLPRSCRAHWRP